MRSRWLPFGCTLLAAFPGLSDPLPASPLAVVGTTRIPLERRSTEPVTGQLSTQNTAVPRRPSGILEVRLRNVSNRTITAWAYTCVFALSDGRMATLSKGDDYFLALARPLSGGKVDERHGPRAPGAEVAVEMPIVRQVDAGPYAAQSCGVTGVIFENLSGWGDPHRLDRLFEGRARSAREALALLTRIEDIESGAVAADTPEQLRLELERALPEGRGGFFRGDLSRTLSTITRRGADVRPALEELRLYVRRTYQGIRRQLRPRDLKLLQRDEGRAASGGGVAR